MPVTGPEVKRQRQILLSDVMRSIKRLGNKLALIALGCILLFLVLPAVGLSAEILGSVEQSSVTGSQVAGGAGYLAAIVFALAASSRYVQPLARYGLLLDYGALTMFLIVLVWSWIGGPLATARGELFYNSSGYGLRDAAMPVSARPELGFVFLLVAPVTLYLSRR